MPQNQNNNKGYFLAIFALLAGLIMMAYSIYSISSFKKPVISKELLLEKQIDSLNLLVHIRDESIKMKDSKIELMIKRQYFTDSLINKTNKDLQNEKNKIKKFTPDTRNKYVDSLLRSAGVRH